MASSASKGSVQPSLSESTALTKLNVTAAFTTFCAKYPEVKPLIGSERSDSKSIGKCEVCRKDSTDRCSKCHVRSYCGSLCQRTEWPVHRIFCGLATLDTVVEMKGTTDKGNGIFARRGWAPYEVIGEEGMLFGVFSEQTSMGILTYKLIKNRTAPLEWLHYHGFKLQRPTLPENGHGEIQEISGLTNVDAKTVEAVYRTLYEYQFCQTSISACEVYGVGIYRISSFINHSCVPNAMWFFSKSGHCRLLALRPIKAGDEVTVSYRSILGVDSYREPSVPVLYQLLNESLCRCGESLCLHKGLAVATLKGLAPRLDYWTLPLQSPLLPGCAKVLVDTVVQQTPSLTHLKKSDQKESGAVDIKLDLPGYKPKEAAESPLTQLLLLCSEAVECAKGLAGFAKEAEYDDDYLASCLSVALSHANATLSETNLRLAMLEYRVALSVYPDALAKRYRAVPTRVLQCLVVN
jgi:hypothetical protein